MVETGPDGAQCRVPARAAEALVEERRSTFLAALARVEDEPAARAFIAERRARNRLATHHCTALRLGPRGELTRGNDDGEPSGTAAGPMLDVLAGRGVTDVVVVVTRHFGGVKLGTGGLARAYAAAVSAALDAAGTLARVRRQRLALIVTPAEAGRVEALLRRLDGVEVEDVTWADEVALTLTLAPQARAALTGALAEALGGEPRIVDGGEVWRDAAR